METFLLSHEPVIRGAVFAVVLAAVAATEMVAPRRALRAPKALRWFNNLTLTAFNTLLLRLLFPILAVGMAALTMERGWGLFNLVALPPWLEVVAAAMALDLAIYLQHVLFHKVPVLWRLHRMHHVDLDIDVTTGARFHPVEIVLSMLLKFAVVVALGAPPLAVLIFELLLNGVAMFNHGNIALPLVVDRWLRLVVVTPDMHRVHHSAIRRETDSNYGFNLPWWDRLFGTYRDQPERGHQGMTIGVEAYQQPLRQSLWWMLALPFRRD
ncbi:MAG: sterol desaturase family protein [Minwuiales bacterium]|nr:sterol desaturase family protein [Minwuiales bacterium]